METGFPMTDLGTSLLQALVNYAGAVLSLFSPAGDLINLSDTRTFR